MAQLGPCYYPGGAEWAIVQARKSSRATSMAPYHIEAQGAVTAVRAATLSDRWSNRVGSAEEPEDAANQEPQNSTGSAPARRIRSLQRKAEASGQRTAALEIVGQPPGVRPEGWVGPIPPTTAAADVRRQSQSWHQHAEPKSVSFEPHPSQKQQLMNEAADEEDLWSAEEPREHQPLASASQPTPWPNDELHLLDRHQALIEDELAQSVKRTYELEERLRAEQRGLSNDILAPANGARQPPCLLTRSIAAEHPWQTMQKVGDPAQADSTVCCKVPGGSPPTDNPTQVKSRLTLSERFDKGRRFQCPGSHPGLAEAQMNMPASGTGSDGAGWVEWPLQRGGEAPHRSSWQQGHTDILPTGLCRQIPAGNSAPAATWWLQQ
jgi:hypothetical protein